MSHAPFEIAPGLSVGANAPLLLIAGPCQMESLAHSLQIAEALKKIAKKFPVNFVFKASFDKANRTSIKGQRGLGASEGLDILAKVRSTVGVPVLTDIHHPEQAAEVAKVVDILQTPAFLCRQTDLLVAAGKTGKPVQIKKGQFLHPSDMAHAAEKVAANGNHKVLLCERGTSFGYRDLVVDPRSLVIMRDLGYPVIFDATHSVQSMGGSSGKSGGDRRFIQPLIRAAIAVGVDGIFIETHEDPARSPSDSDSMLPLAEMERTLEMACALRKAAQTKTS